jgi:hypothetical protein
MPIWLMMCFQSPGAPTSTKAAYSFCRMSFILFAMPDNSSCKPRLPPFSTLPNTSTHLFDLRKGTWCARVGNLLFREYFLVTFFITIARDERVILYHSSRQQDSNLTTTRLTNRKVALAHITCKITKLVPHGDANNLSKSSNSTIPVPQSIPSNEECDHHSNCEHDGIQATNLGLLYGVPYRSYTATWPCFVRAAMKVL